MIILHKDGFELPKDSEANIGHHLMAVDQLLYMVQNRMPINPYDDIYKDVLENVLQNALESIRNAAILNGYAKPIDGQDPPFEIKGYLIRNKSVKHFNTSLPYYIVYQNETNIAIAEDKELIPVLIIPNLHAERSEAGEPKPNIQS